MYMFAHLQSQILHHTCNSLCYFAFKEWTIQRGKCRVEKRWANGKYSTWTAIVIVINIEIDIDIVSLSTFKHPEEYGVRYTLYVFLHGHVVPVSVSRLYLQISSAKSLLDKCLPPWHPLDHLYMQKKLCFSSCLMHETCCSYHQKSPSDSRLEFIVPLTYLSNPIPTACVEAIYVHITCP